MWCRPREPLVGEDQGGASGQEAWEDAGQRAGHPGSAQRRCEYRVTFASPDSLLQGSARGLPPQVSAFSVAPV